MMDVLAAAATPDAVDSIFGFTLAAFALASFLGLLGMAYLVYAKRQGRLIVGLSGIALIIVPFVTSRVIPLAIVGGVLAFLPLILKRIGIDL